MTIWEKASQVVQDYGLAGAVLVFLGWAARRILTEKSRVDALEKTQERILDRIDSIHDHLIGKK